MPGPQATRVRWLVLAMLFIVTTINVADRATISIAGTDIRKAFDLSPLQIGYIFAAFAVSRRPKPPCPGVRSVPAG